MMSRNNLFLVLYVLGALLCVSQVSQVVEAGNETQGQFVGTEPGGETNETLGSDYEQDESEPEEMLFGTDDENFVKSEGKDIGESGSSSFSSVTTTAGVAATASVVVASAIAAVFAL